jgi:F-type H+-transporting ATPase subunit b
MADVQREASQALAQAKADAVKLADTIRAQAEAESAALKDRTLREIDAAKQQALTEINTHAADLGTAVARKILQRDVTVNDQQRLVDESLAELAKKN